MGQDHLGAPPGEEPSEVHLEIFVDDVEGLLEALRGGAVDFFDGLIEVRDGSDQVIILSGDVLLVVVLDCLLLQKQRH